MWYYISEPNSYLAITGGGIETVRIVKKAFVMPWQKVTKISISPFDFSLSLQAMTIEKLQFALPAVFTIGPDDRTEALEKYAVLLTGGPDGSPASSKGKGGIQPTGRNHVQDIVKGIIEGETRVIVSGMSMEEIFKERQVFKQKVITNVQSELDQFGLRIYNANVKELQDTPGSEYFQYLSRKAHEGALNQAKIDVAEARMLGEIGEKQKQGRTRQEVSKIDAQTAVLETERKGEKATAEAQLATKQTELEMNLNIAKIKAKRQAEARDAELQKEVETRRAETELERLRATDVTKSKIRKESAQQQADGDYYTALKAADGNAYKEQKAAEAALYRKQKEADAAAYTRTREAEANFTAQKKEAEGLMAMAEAYGKMADVFGPQGVLQMRMMEMGIYGELARANAQAIHGMQPKINVWNTGAAGGDGGMADPTAPIRNLFQALPPLLSTINDQTGIQPPAWLATMPQQQQQQLSNKEKMMNGQKAANAAAKQATA
jgi:flotillin